MARRRFQPHPAPRRMAALWRVPAIAALLLGLSVTCNAAQTVAEKTFRIAAGDAADTLKIFAAQAGEQIVYLVDTVRGEHTRALQGRFTARAALELMLAGTVLQASQDPATGALVVVRKSLPAGRMLPESPQTTAARAARGIAGPSAPRVDVSSADAIVRLSPFAVHDDRDRGYQVTSTLAGTRLSSELKDLAASISVVTREFMNDVHATDLTSLLVYTLGTEVGGYGGNFSDLSNPEAQGIFDDALGQASPGTRIRGLIHADRTRNYFLTDVPMDGYNLERVEISRGANANLFGLGSPAGIINSNLIAADPAQTSTSISTSLGSYSSHRTTLDHNHVLAPGMLALRVAALFDQRRYRTAFAHEKRRGVTLTGTYRPFAHTSVRVTSELGRNDSNRPEQRPPFDRFSWWWAAGQPVWDPAAPGGGAGRLLGPPGAPFTTSTVFNPNGSRTSSNFLTSNWSGAAPNEPLLLYLDPNSSTLGGLRIGNGTTVDGVKMFAQGAALSRDARTLVSAGMLGLNTQLLVEQVVHQASNPLRTLYSREPMVSDPAVFDFFHEMLGGPTKYEFARWEAHNVTIEQTFLDQRAGIELTLDRQRVDSGFTSPLNYSINLDPNERLPDGAPNPNFLRPIALGSGFKRIYSQDRDAARATAFYRLDWRESPHRLVRWLGRHRHLLSASYARQDQLYQQFGGTLWNTGLDWRVYEGFDTPGTTSSVARIVAVGHYLGDSFLGLSSPQQARVQGLTAGQDPTGISRMTLLAHPRPATLEPSALAPWESATFDLVTNGREDVRNTIRNAQRYADRLEQQVRSFSAVAQSHWFSGNLVTTAGWRRDRVASFDAGLPAMTPLGTADVRWEVWHPRLTRSLAESAASFGVVAHLPPSWRRRLPAGVEGSVFYNYATNFRVAPQRYTITGVSLPSETGRTREYGIRLGALHGRFDVRLTRYETVADHATVSGFVNGLNQLAMMVPQVVEHNFLGDNADNPAGIAAFEAWLASPYGRIYRDAFAVDLTPNTDPARPASQFGGYASATADRGQISGVSSLKSTGYELELMFNPTPRWRILANVATAEATRTNIAPELYDFLFNSNSGLVSLVQGPDGSPSPAGRLIGTPIGGTTAPLHTFVHGNVINLGIVSTFAQSGTRTDELRDWSFRAVTHYTFSDEAFGGRLKGFGIGGALRWSDAPLLGYAGKTTHAAGSVLAVADTSRPYFGETEAICDGWISYRRTLRRGVQWKLQLNVRNLGVDNELRPLAAWPDGRVVQWTIREPQRWTLTSTFTF